MGVRDDYVKAIKSAFVSIGQTLAMSYITAHVPPLGLPVIRQIISWCIGKILEIMVNSTELGVYFVYTDFRTNEQGLAFIDVALKNRETQLTGSDEEKRASEQLLMQKFSEFVRVSS